MRTSMDISIGCWIKRGYVNYAVLNYSTHRGEFSFRPCINIALFKVNFINPLRTNVALTQYFISNFFYSQFMLLSSVSFLIMCL